MLAPLRALIRFNLDHWAWVALASAIFMLGMAHYFQTFQHLAPCLLCLKQREAYWIAGTIAVVAVVANQTPWRATLYRLFCLLLCAAFLYSLGMATYHMGAEYKWWPGPQACAIGGDAKASDIAAMLNGAKMHAPSCEDPVWWFPTWPFRGLTMAGWNVIISAKLAGWSLAAAILGRTK
jgi:disulfide bond formation protein DsbB